MKIVIPTDVAFYLVDTTNPLNTFIYLHLECLIPIENRKGIKISIYLFEHNIIYICVCDKKEPSISYDVCY